MNSSKQLTILITVIATFAASLASYLYITSSANQNAAGEQTGSILARFDGLASPTPTPIPDGLLQLTNDRALNPVNDSESDSVLYYHANDGTVSKVGLGDRQKTQISSTVLPRLTRVVWSPDRKKVITVYATRSGQQFKYFNYQTRQTVVLDPAIVDAVFSPDSQSVAFVKVTADETDIVVARPDGSTPQTILKSHLERFTLTWPSDRLFGMQVPNPNGTGADFYVLTDTGDLTKALEAQPALQVRWAPDGQHFLYSTTSNNTNILALYTLADGTSRPLSISAAAGLCDWFMDGRSFVCLTDDGESSTLREISTADLSVKTLAANLITSPDSAFISQLEDYFVLVDRNDKSLWAVRLPR